MERPLTKPIALLIPVYNRQQGLEKTLASLRPEKHLLDIVLVDDGSTPPLNTENFPDLSIHHLRLPANRGLHHALNAGLEYIYPRNPPFIARLDADDTAVAGRFAAQLAYLQAHPEIGLLGSSYYLVGKEEEERAAVTFIFNTQKSIMNAMYLRNFFLHPTIMMRTAVAQAVGFYSPRYPSADDYDFCMRMIRKSGSAITPDHWIEYAAGDSTSISNARRYEQAWSALKVKLRFFSPWNPYAYLGIIFSLGGMALMPRLRSRIEALVIRKMYRVRRQ